LRVIVVDQIQVVAWNIHRMSTDHAP
jgi:hypothetical protein